MRKLWNTSGGRGAALIAALAVVLSACGGSDQGAATTTTAATAEGPASGRAEYVAEADAYCTRIAANTELTESLAALRKIPETSPEFAERAAAHFRLVRDVALDAREELGTMEPPDALRPRVEDFLGVNDEAIDELDGVIAALERGETSSDFVDAYVGKLAEADSIAEEIGFEVCGRTGQG
jgi:hypothetical protein